MERLTNKDYKEYASPELDELVSFANINPNDVCKSPVKELREQQLKLGQLEDIEDDLGIDLITLIKVWNAVLQKEYLWTKYDNELDKTDDIEIGDEMNGLLYIYFYWSDGKHLVLYLKDYGKTWALTKEELENKGE